VNETTLRRIDENLTIAKTAICRSQMLFRTELTDPGYELLRKLSQAHSDMEAYLSGQIQIASHDSAEARLGDLKRWLKHNPDATDASIVNAVRAHIDG
jgi:hypothetical protein